MGTLASRSESGIRRPQLGDRRVARELDDGLAASRSHKVQVEMSWQIPELPSAEHRRQWQFLEIGSRQVAVIVQSPRLGAGRIGRVGARGAVLGRPREAQLNVTNPPGRVMRAMLTKVSCQCGSCSKHSPESVTS